MALAVIVVTKTLPQAIAFGLVAEKLFPSLLYIASPTEMKSSNSDHKKKLMCELADAC